MNKEELEVVDEVVDEEDTSLKANMTGDANWRDIQDCITQFEKDQQLKQAK